MKLDLSVSYQKKLLSILLRNRKLMSRYVDYLSPQTFDEGVLRALWIEIRNIHRKYKMCPVFSSLDDRIRELRSDEKIKSDEAQLLFKALRRIKKTSVNGFRSHIITRVDHYRSYKLIKNNIKDIQKNLKRGDFAEVDKLLRASMNHQASSDDSPEILRAVGQCMAEIQIMEDCAVPTLLPSLDRMLSGGLKPEELGVVMAGTGVGKSMFLVSLGKAAVILGRCVVHISTELSRPRTARRYYSAFTHIPIRKVAKKYRTVRKRVERGVQLFQGELWVKKVPMMGSTVSDIRAYLNKLIEEKVSPDILLIDYADQLSPTGRKGKDISEYEGLGLVYTELSDLAKDLKLPIWTASQTNREALSKVSPTLKEMAASMKKAMIADIVFALAQTSDEQEEGTMRGIPLKVREGKRRPAIPMIADLDYATIKESNGCA